MLLLFPLLSAAQSQGLSSHAQGLQHRGGAQPSRPRLCPGPGKGQQRSCCQSKAALPTLGCSQLLLTKCYEGLNFISNP